MSDTERYNQWKNTQERIDRAVEDDNRPISVSVDENGWKTSLHPDGTIKIRYVGGIK